MKNERNQRELVYIVRTLSHLTDMFYDISTEGRMEFSNGVQQSINAVANLIGEAPVHKALEED